MKKVLTLLAFVALMCGPAAAQNPDLTKEKVLAMSVDELSDLSLEELMYAVELLDLQSVDELFSLVMNKNVSSASKKAEDAFKSPLSTSVLTREEMRTFGCTTLEEALRLMTGMIVREKTNGNYDIHMRGLDNIPDANMLLYTENVNTLLMINGRPSFNPATGATMWEQLPVSVEDIERIEIVRGPSSALYGSNAVTGVINIITEKPNVDSKLVSGAVQLGSCDTYVGDVALRKAFTDKLAGSISFNYQSRNRETSKIYVLPNWGVFDPNDPTTDYNNNVWVDVAKLYDLRTMSSSGDISKLSEHSSDIFESLPHPELSRRMAAANGALSFNPAADIALDFTGGYQFTRVMTTTIGSDYWPLNERETNTFYADLTGNVKGVNFQLNYTGGAQNFMVGTPGFKADSRQFTANLEYDWQLTEGLTIRPGVNYRWNQADDTQYDHNYDIDKFGNRIKLSSYFNGIVTLRALAPSLRIDYSPISQLRFVGAYRAEKLNLPDDIYHSWQAAATFSPSENHNLRLIYSRANRSANFTNTSSNYKVTRVDYGSPDEIEFLGNPEARVMIADNYELGYRVRPTQKFMLDFEAFYNKSRDYGSLMSHSANLFMTTENFMGVMYGIGDALTQVAMGALPYDQLSNQIVAVAAAPVITKAYVQYNNLPYVVHQMGASLAADWVVSNKLVVKANLNIQRTTIDNYYTYHKHADIGEQFVKATDFFSGAITEFTGLMANEYTRDWLSVENMMSGRKECHVYRNEYEAQTDKEAYLQQFFNKEDILTYFGLKYGCETNDDFSYITIGRSTAHEPHIEEDGYEHKYTPSFYGSIGLIYKPIEKLSIASHAYFYSKQTSVTENGTAQVDGKCIVNLKVGYKPTEQFEVFFNSHNLFNNRTREFDTCDYTPGIYSMGVNFGF